MSPACASSHPAEHRGQRAGAATGPRCGRSAARRVIRLTRCSIPESYGLSERWPGEASRCRRDLCGERGSDLGAPVGDRAGARVVLVLAVQVSQLVDSSAGDDRGSSARQIVAVRRARCDSAVRARAVEAVAARLGWRRRGPMRAAIAAERRRATLDTRSESGLATSAARRGRQGLGRPPRSRNGSYWRR